MGNNSGKFVKEIHIAGSKANMKEKGTTFEAPAGDKVNGLRISGYQLVGLNYCAGVGSVVGADVGATVGIEEGAGVGVHVGAGVGATVGCEVGAYSTDSIRQTLQENDVRAILPKLDTWEFPKCYLEYEPYLEKLVELEKELEAFIEELDKLLQENDVRALRAKLEEWKFPETERYPEYQGAVEKVDPL